jgi:hypothetical protein
VHKKLIILVVVVVAASCSSQPSSTETTPSTGTSAPAGGVTPSAGAKVQRPAAVATMALAVTPPAGAKTDTAVGWAEASIGTANEDQDSDSFWVEEVDFDGDGTSESAELLWDDEDKVLFIGEDGPFTCINGGQGDGGLLMAIFADGNPRAKPSGSGWWVTNLDEGECGVKAAGIYGCRFDASGLATECGSITVDPATDDITITTIQ